MMKEARVKVRDVVVHWCRALCKKPRVRDEFIVKLAEAYEGNLDTNTKAQLMLAYHRCLPKDRTHCGFVSNNQVATDARGGWPRRRRERNAWASDRKMGQSDLCVGVKGRWVRLLLNWNAKAFCVVPSSNQTLAAAAAGQEVGPHRLCEKLPAAGASSHFTHAPGDMNAKALPQDSLFHDETHLWFASSAKPHKF